MHRIWKMGLLVASLIAGCGDAPAIDRTAPPALPPSTTASSAAPTTVGPEPTRPPVTITAAPTTTASAPSGAVVLTDADPAEVAAYSTIAEWYGSFGPMEPLGTDDGDGNGCTPGSDTLPDGIWFGRVVAVTDETIEFDLMCRYSDDARQAVHTPEEVDFDTSSTNRSDRLRSVTIGENAVWFIPLSGELTRLMIPALSDVTPYLDAARPGWLLVDQGAMMEFFAEPNID